MLLLATPKVDAPPLPKGEIADEPKSEVEPVPAAPVIDEPNVGVLLLPPIPLPNGLDSDDGCPKVLVVCCCTVADC